MTELFQSYVLQVIAKSGVRRVADEYGFNSFK